MRTFAGILVLIVFVNVASGFIRSFGQRSSRSFLNMESYDFSNLQKKLLDKSATKKETVVDVPKAAPLKKVEVKKVQQAPAPVKTEAKVVSPTVTKPVIEKKVETVAKVAVPPPSADAVSFGDAALGITLGVVPYLLLPAVAFNAAKGLVKKAKPLPVEPAPKVKTYSKSIGEGLKEGIAEFAAGNISPDVRKALQLSAIGFGTAIGLTAVSLVINPSGEVKEAPVVKVAPKESPKPTATTKATPAVKVAPVTKPAPAPVPAPKVEPAPAPKPVPVPEPAPAPKVAPVPEPAPAPKPVPVPEPAPAPKVAPVPEPAPAPKPVPAPAPAPKVAPKAAGDEVVEVYKAPDVSADKVDLSALKSLRKSKSSN